MAATEKSEEDDPFSGTWRFNAARSALDTPSPGSWIQTIRATSEGIQVCERIGRADSPGILVSIQAKFDGADYPVDGSPAVDTISYSRIDWTNIMGIGKKDGAISLTETVTVDANTRTLTHRYLVYRNLQVVATGIAVFEAADGIDI
jgi:hypothetical protein